MAMFYYPNRPILVPPDPQNPMRPSPDYINSLENSGRYIAEKKWNGDNVLINTNTFEFWNREKKLHRYRPSDIIKEEISKWPKSCLINAELVHYKTKTIKDTIIVHCVMIWKGKPLIGKTWGDSRKILEEMPSGNHLKISPIYHKGFWDIYQQADGTIIEGIILKDPKGKLTFSVTPIKDVPWMLKIRKPSKKYPF